MTERDRTALDVDRRRDRDPSRAAAVSATAANASLNSHTAMSLTREVRAVEQLLRGHRRRQRQVRRIPGGAGVTFDRRERFDAVALRVIRAREHEGRRAVVDARRVAGRDRAAGVERLKFRHRFERRIGANRFVAVDERRRCVTGDVRRVARRIGDHFRRRHVVPDRPPARCRQRRVRVRVPAPAARRRRSCPSLWWPPGSERFPRRSDRLRARRARVRATDRRIRLARRA